MLGVPAANPRVPSRGSAPRANYRSGGSGGGNTIGPLPPHNFGPTGGGGYYDITNHQWTGQQDQANQIQGERMAAQGDLRSNYGGRTPPGNFAAPNPFDTRRMNDRNALIDEYNAWDRRQQGLLGSGRNLDLASASAYNDLNIAELMRAYGTDLGLLGEGQYRNVDLERDYIGAQIAHNQTNRGILSDRQQTAQDRFGSQFDYLQGVQQDILAQYGFADRAYQGDVGRATLSRDVSNRAARSDATARGAFTSRGFHDNLGAIAEQYGLSMDEAKLIHDKAYQSTAEAGRATDQDIRNLGFNLRDTQSGFQSEQANLDLQSAGHDKAMKALDSLANEYGIRRQDLERGLENAISRAGLDLAETQRSIRDAFASGNQARIRASIDFMTQMMAYA